VAIAVIIEFDVKPECLAEFEAKLRHDAAETLRDDGCLRMEIVHPRGAPQRIVLSELWRDEAAIAAHRAKPGHTHAWQETLIQRKRSIVGEVQ
jgi:quinol monooxygenase YgiN